MSAVTESFATAFRLIVHADPALVRTVALSLAVSGSACLCAAGFGLASIFIARSVTKLKAGSQQLPSGSADLAPMRGP